MNKETVAPAEFWPRLRRAPAGGEGPAKRFANDQHKSRAIITGPVATRQHARAARARQQQTCVRAPLRRRGPSTEGQAHKSARSEALVTSSRACRLLEHTPNREAQPTPSEAAGLLPTAGVCYKLVRFTVRSRCVEGCLRTSGSCRCVRPTRSLIVAAASPLERALGAFQWLFVREPGPRVMFFHVPMTRHVTLHPAYFGQNFQLTIERVREWLCGGRRLLVEPCSDAATEHRARAR